MGLWIAAVTQGLAYAFLAWAAFLSLRTLRFADISVDGTFTTGAATTAVLLLRGLPPLVATGIGVVAGFLGGTITGLIHTKLGINDLLSGILVMTAAWSINLHIMGRSNVPLLESPTVIGMGSRIGLSPDSYWTPLVVFLALILLHRIVLVWFLKTDYGLALRATGDNGAMVAAQGIGSDSIKIICLAVSNALAALSGALVVQYQGFADISMGIGSLVAGIAGLVIGERLVGTRSVGWRVTGAVVGAIVYRLIIALALYVGFDPIDLKVLTAVFVLIALSVPSFKRRRRMA